MTPDALASGANIMLRQEENTHVRSLGITPAILFTVQLITKKSESISVKDLVKGSSYIQPRVWTKNIPGQTVAPV